MNANWGNFVARSVTVIALLGFWEVAANHGWIEQRWFSSPSQIGVRLLQEWTAGSIVQDTWVTIFETAIGFAAGVIGGIIFGVALGFMHRLREILMPYLQAIYGIPRPALAPVFVLWFGVGILSKMVLIFSLVYFVVLLYVIAGFRNINQNHIRLAATIGATYPQILVKIIIPTILPGIFEGMRLGIGLAIVGAVVGEFISSDAGLGHYILQSSFRGDTDGIYVGLAGLGVISVTFVASMNSADRHFFPWRAGLKQ